MLQFCIPVSSF